MYSTTTNSPIVVKTLKQWVLPPRPKPGRKNLVHDLAATTPMATSVSSPTTGGTTPPRVVAITSSLPPPKIIHQLKGNITAIDRENLALKLSLLLLISDYQHLKNLVLNGDYIDATATSPSATVANANANANRVKATKRSFAEVAAMLELINDINELSYDTPTVLVSSLPVATTATDTIDDDAFAQYITLEANPPSYLDELDDDISDQGHHDIDLPLLRLLRTISPTLDFDMTSSLTRTTTQTSVATVADVGKVKAFGSRKFFELPKFEEEASAAHAFKFDAMMLAAAPDDEYHMINDFLEEKLIDNDLKYYVDHDQILDKW